MIHVQTPLQTAKTRTRRLSVSLPVNCPQAVTLRNVELVTRLLRFSPGWLCGVPFFESAAHINLNICFESHMLASNLQFTWPTGPYSSPPPAAFELLTSLPTVIRPSSI